MANSQARAICAGVASWRADDVVAHTWPSRGLPKSSARNGPGVLAGACAAGGDRNLLLGHHTLRRAWPGPYLVRASWACSSLHVLNVVISAAVSVRLWCGAVSGPHSGPPRAARDAPRSRRSDAE